jgi:hypothetical protein
LDNAPTFVRVPNGIAFPRELLSPTAGRMLAALAGHSPIARERLALAVLALYYRTIAAECG